MPKLEISYDAGSDVLYISIGEPRPGIATECNDGDFIRTDLATNEVVGITLLDFRERFIQFPPDELEKAVQRSNWVGTLVCGGCFKHPTECDCLLKYARQPDLARGRLGGRPPFATVGFSHLLVCNRRSDADPAKRDPDRYQCISDCVKYWINCCQCLASVPKAHDYRTCNSFPTHPEILRF